MRPVLISLLNVPIVWLLVLFGFVAFSTTSDWTQCNVFDSRFAIVRNLIFTMGYSSDLISDHFMHILLCKEDALLGRRGSPVAHATHAVASKQTPGD